MENLENLTIERIKKTIERINIIESVLSDIKKELYFDNFFNAHATSDEEIVENKYVMGKVDEMLIIAIEVMKTEKNENTGN